MNRTAYARLRRFVEERGFDRFFLYRPENFAWLTGGGDSTVVIGEEVGFLEVGEGIILHTSTIEAHRLAVEEQADFELVPYPWYSPPPIQRPNDLEFDLTFLRLVLSPEEQDRFRRLGRDTAGALGEAMRAARSEWTERRLAGEIARAAYARGIQPIVLLAAGEERVFEYRHPLPKDRPLGRLGMGVICGRRDGLVANCTRMRRWGHPEADVPYEELLHVEAAALRASVPGRSLGEVVDEIVEAYRKIGAADAFSDHHQGGLAGYRPREVLGVPGEGTKLEIGMAVAWNPSLPGAKVEDTFLITADGLENLTHDPAWPTVSIGGRLRPAILEDRT